MNWMLAKNVINQDFPLNFVSLFRNIRLETFNAFCWFCQGPTFDHPVSASHNLRVNFQSLASESL